MSDSVRELHKRWGRNIERQRKMLGLTQVQLSILLHVKQQSVSRWEAGDAAPRDGLKLEIAKVLRTHVDTLFPLVAIEVA